MVATGPADSTRLAAAYIAMGIASGLCGIGQGRATASAAEAMARNPGAIAAIRVALIIGLVLIESLALYTLVITSASPSNIGCAVRSDETTRNLPRTHQFVSITKAICTKLKVYQQCGKLNQIALSGYTVCGSTGETPLLSTDERSNLMEWVREASAEGKTLIAGVGAESVHETVRVANPPPRSAIHVALVLTPFYYRGQMHRPDTQALFFRSVADRSKIPVLLYNIPQVTGYDLPVDTIAELSHHPNIIGMKDSSGNLEKLKETVAAAKPGFQVSRAPASVLAKPCMIGATGAILAIANPLPYACVTIWEAFRTREFEAGKGLASTPSARRPRSCGEIRHTGLEARHGIEWLLRRPAAPALLSAVSRGQSGNRAGVRRAAANTIC